MSEMRYDVVGIGNAIVDILSRETDEFLKEQDLTKGAMALIDADQADQLYGVMGAAVEESGGSAANTMAGIASLGGKAAFIGKVCDDQIGGIFAHDIRAAGVAFDTEPAAAGDSDPTACCLIVVTPDGQRTMSTYLGAAQNLTPLDVDEAVIASAQITYLEGYLWDPPKAKEAFLKATKAAHAAGRKVSLSLSDSFCVDRHRDEFLALLKGEVDILFANEDEIRSLYQTESFAEAVSAVRGHCEIAALTRSKDGALIIRGDEEWQIDSAPVDKIEDSTGAGDLFAAGFLFGVTHDRPLPVCGEIAALAAAEIISHVGARPKVLLKDYVASAMR